MYVQDSYAILLELVSKTLTQILLFKLKKNRIIWIKLTSFAPRMTIIHLDFPDFFSRLSDCHYNDKINCNNSLEFTPIL